MTVKIFVGDVLDRIKEIPDASIDAIVTDPPYDLTSARPGGRSEATKGKVMKGFMGMEWDGSGIAFNPAVWVEALRVLKPGGHLLAFGGTRTYHRMACAIEDAGFEVRDQIADAIASDWYVQNFLRTLDEEQQRAFLRCIDESPFGGMLAWVYASGFPKSLDVSKAIDKAAGVEREGTGEMVRAGSRAARGGAELVGSDPVEAAKWKEVTLPVTDAAKEWDGWGTALKPAWEPIIMARKPLVGTVVQNVLQHRTGALNINAARIPLEGDYKSKPNGRPSHTGLPDHYDPENANEADTQGRWPANLIHDGSEEVMASFPNAPGALLPVKGDEPSGKTKNAFGEFEGRTPSDQRDGGGSAARFFYCAKPDRAEREMGLRGRDRKTKNWSSGTQNPGSFQSENTDRTSTNHHPTVKPVALMRYLCKLVTPQNGVILDCFAGSGSTGIAALREGFGFVGIEKSPEYADIAKARLLADSPMFTVVELC